MRFFRTAVAAFSILAAPALWAQDPVVARVGATVRVTAPSVSPQPLVGILDGANDSHLRLATSAGPTVIPRNAVQRLEWSRGLHKPLLKRAKFAYRPHHSTRDIFATRLLESGADIR